MHPSSLHSTQGYRTSKRALDSLFVMANHGQLLEYSLEPTHDQTIPREKVCEGSAIELKVTAYGQWNLSKPAGKDRKEMTPPLASNNLLLLTRSLCKTQEEECWGSADEEDERWLSQVEILTHIGPARRLWMGPQFSFRPFQKPGEEDELKDLDVTVACRPRSDPVQMPGGGIMRHKPVYIECGSANSFELSPRFAPTTVRGSREQVHLDVEQEIREAMSDTVNFDLHPRGQGDLKGQGEEFFCISTEDVSKKGEEEVAGEGRGRGMAGEGRSRSGSNVSGSRSRHSSSTLYRGVEMMTAEGKIFSVAVSQGKSKQEQSFVYKDMDNQPTDRPVILSSNTKSGDKNLLDDSDSEFLPVHRDPTAVLEHAADACTQNKNKLPSKVEAEEKSEVVLGEAEQELIQSEIQSAISQEEEKKPSDQPENKKKNKKKKGRAVEPPTNYSSADEVKEVETKARKKKGKNKDKEEEKKPAEAPKDLLDDDFPSLGDTSSVQQKESKQPLEACKASSPPASSSIKEDTPPPSSSSNNQKQNEKPKRTKKNSESDLLQFSSTAEVEEDDEDDSKFFIRERSSSIDSELVESATRVNPYAAKPQESVWLENILKRGTSMIENQISGAVWKYEEDDDKNSCDEEMKECESGDRENGNGTEDHSPHLLQEEEVSPVEKALDTVADKLSELVTDDKDNAPASDDDFVPVTSSGKKNKKNKGKSAIKDDDDMKSAVDDNAVKTAADDVTAAAAVEEMVTTVDDVSRKESTEKSSKIEEGMKSKDGWSFEVDEEDVNRLLFENATREDTKKDEGLSFSGVLLSNGPRPDQQGKGRGKGRGRGKVDDAGGQEEKQAPGSGSRSCRDSEERTALEDVFRFDSEMTETLDETETPASDKVIKGAKVSHEDLSDALKDETDSEAETGGRKCETTDEDMSCGESEKPVFSSSYPGTGTSSCSEGSVTNSPWATKTKGRKNKKKKR